MASNNEFDITAKISNLDAIKKALSDVTVNVKLNSPELNKLLGFANSGLNVKVNLIVSQELKQLLDLSKNGINVNIRGGGGGSGSSSSRSNDPLINNPLARGQALLSTLRAGGNIERFLGTESDLAGISPRIDRQGDRAFVLETQIARVRADRAQKILDLENKATAAQIAKYDKFFANLDKERRADSDRQLKDAFANQTARANQINGVNIGSFSKIDPGKLDRTNRNAAKFFEDQKTPSSGFGDVLKSLNFTSTIYQFRVLKEAIEVLIKPLSEASEAAFDFERSAVGIGATLSAQTIRLRNGKPVGDVESAKLNLEQGFASQDALRKVLAPLGVSSEIGNAIGQGLTQGFAGTKGFNDDFLSKAGARIAAFTSVADSPLLNSPTRFLKDFSDITNQTAQAKNTQLGARLSRIAPEAFTATSAEEFEKATKILDTYVQALKSSNTALQANLELQGAFKNAQIDLGEAFNKALAPGVKELADTLQKEGVSEQLKDAGTAIGTLGRGALFLTSGLVEFGNVIGSVNKGLKDVGKAAYNLIDTVTDRILGRTKEVSAKDEQVPNFNKRINNIGKFAGLDLIEDAQKRAASVPTSTLIRISKESLKASGTLKPGEDPTNEELGNLRTADAQRIAELVKKEQVRVSKSFNLNDAGSNLDYLKANSKALDEAVNAQIKAVNATKFQLDVLQRDSSADPSAVKAAIEKVAEEEKKLAEVRTEVVKNIVAEANAQKQLADALRATIETTTFRGKAKELGQRQQDISADNARNAGLFRSGNITSTEFDLRNRQNALAKFNAGVEQERLPGQQRLAGAQLNLTGVLLQNLPIRQALDREALQDQGTALRRQLANFKEDKRLRELTREGKVVDSAAALGAAGGVLDESKLPKNLSPLARQAAVEEATKALEAFKDKVDDTTRSISKFESETELRRLQSGNRIINAARALGAAGGSLNSVGLPSSISSDIRGAAFEQAAEGLKQFNGGLIKAVVSFDSLNQAIQNATDRYNEVTGTVLSPGIKKEETAEFQIAKDRDIENARQALLKVTDGTAGQSDESFSAFDNPFTKRVAKDTATEELKSAIFDENNRTANDSATLRGFKRNLPNSKDVLNREIAGENLRVAGREFKQGPEIDEETIRSLERAIKSNDLDLKELPLKQLIETISKTNELLESRQALGKTAATGGSDATISPDGKTVSGSGGTFNLLPLQQAFTIGSELTPGNFQLGADLFGATSGTASPSIGTNAKGAGVASDIIRGLVDRDKNNAKGARQANTDYFDKKNKESKDSIFDISSNNVPLSKQDIADGTYSGMSRALRESFT